MDNVQTLRPSRPFTDWLGRNRRALSAVVILLVLWLFFVASAPTVFLDIQPYTAMFYTLPIGMILTVPLVFVVVSGEIDLAFPSIYGLAALAFAACANPSVMFPTSGFAEGSGLPLLVCLLAALLAGAFGGFINAVLVTRLKLSSLVSTLGMSFLLRGLINIITAGTLVPLSSLAEQNPVFFDVFAGNIGPVPTALIWALLVVVIGYFLFNQHIFGAQIRAVGDNSDSAREMGIDVAAVKTKAYIFTGLCAGFAAVLASLLNRTFFPTAGDGYLLPTLAAVFIGGTPTWGGVGTIVGAAIGAITVGVIDTGIIAAGYTGFYTQFAYGVVIILALLGHRFNRGKSRLS